MGAFFYQIGNITTTNAWSRPTYDLVRTFFKNSEVAQLSTKYKITIVGGFLYKKQTWDLDLYLLYDYDENTDWNQVESDMNTLNNIALNECGLLLDISVTNKPLSLYSKRELIEINKGKSFEDWTFPRTSDDSSILMKIGAYKKVIDGNIEFDTMDYDLSELDFGIITKLTDGYLSKMDRRGTIHRPKMIDTIMRTNISDNIRHDLSYKDFLSMSKKEFNDSRIYLSETIDTSDI